MRRKTKAKRVLDPGNEEEKQQDEEEGGEEEGTEHGLQLKRRKKMQAARGKADRNSPSAVGLHKPRMGAFDLEINNMDNVSDCNSTREESDYLLSRSKSELIAMVLCMQREMEGLREQIRCLTACGKLARNIEALIEKTQTWASGDDSMPAALDMQGVQTGGQQALTPAATPAAAVVQQASPREGILTEPESQRKRLYVLPEYITQDLLDNCNTTATAQKLTNDLLRGLYERECLASHSISGIVYNKKGSPKPALPADEVQTVLSEPISLLMSSKLGTVQHFFPGKTDAEIKGYIRQKLQNEAKRLRRKPQPPEIKDS
ncbi:uncharacterized protein LOC117434828 isoform X2 [Acipenser ruthenus]|uniref:uncharacterized protein LOC117434828 isoform X2 n=1 Tax=Acipenser ruthenus TaxID=7906 RepID=UPI00145A295A|nr:uncharacterized protein LOC117434828 isoform X2 [Acipenser ruthenus]